MKRIAVVAVGAAVLLGGGSGVAFALHAAPQDPGTRTTGTASGPAPADTPSTTPTEQPSSGPSATPSPSGTPSPTATPTPPATPLLYATATQIHDGSTTVGYHGPRDVVAIARADGGWVLSTRPDSGGRAGLWHVAASGSAAEIATIEGAWDLDAQGTHVAAHDSESGQIGVWPVADAGASPIGNTPADRRTRVVGGFVGDRLLMAVDGSGVLWDAATGTSSKPTSLRSFSPTIVSPGGSYAAGADAGTGKNCLAVRSVAHTQKPVSWDSCDYRLYPGTSTFSPDGTRLLAVPAGTDGFGPSSIDAIDASDGPARLVGDIHAPAHTLGAGWAGNDAVYVYGSRTDDPAMADGAWIDRCSMAGSCTRVVSTAGPVALGSTR